MAQLTFQTDPGLATALRKQFGWPSSDDAVFTMIQTGQSGQTITLVFDGGHRLNIHVTEIGPGLLAVDWGWRGPKPTAEAASQIGRALEEFFVRAGLIGLGPGNASIL